MYDEAMDDILFAEPDKIAKVIRGEEELASDIDIEDALLEMNRFEREVDFYKKLKKKRVEPLDARIKSNGEKIEILKTAIKSRMQVSDTKKLDFPGVAKITQRKKAGAWEIVDQEKLDAHLSGLELINDIASREWKYDKKKLTKTLNELNDNNNIPKDIAVKGDDGVSLVLSFSDEATGKSKDAEDKRDAERWQKASERPAASQAANSSEKVDELVF